MSASLATAGYFNQEQYADILIKYGSRTKPCHKIIICPRSEYFAKLCGAESKFAEANKDCIELKDDNEEAVETMLRWLYTFKYETQEPGAQSNLDSHIQVYLVADKYCVRDLKGEALKRCNAQLADCSTDDAEGIVTRAWLQDEPFPPVLNDAITKLRDSKLPHLLKKPTFRKAVCRNPQKAEYVLEIFSTLTKQTLTQCNDCEKVFSEAGICPFCRSSMWRVRNRVAWLAEDAHRRSDAQRKILF